MDRRQVSKEETGEGFGMLWMQFARILLRQKEKAILLRQDGIRSNLFIFGGFAFRLGIGLFRLGLVRQEDRFLLFRL